MAYLVNMKLNWSKYLFFYVKRRRKSRIIGHNIFSTCRSQGKYIIIDGLCISIKSTKHFLLTSSITLKKKSSDLDYYYFNFPIYLTNAKFKITGLTYGFNINCSKLVNIRLK